jgi:hypothetical protein
MLSDAPRKGPKVLESDLISGPLSSKDAWWIAIPFGLLVLVQFFRLDTLVASARRPKSGQRRFCGPDSVGELVLTDPDGRVVETHRAAGSTADQLQLTGRLTGADLEGQPDGE